MIWIIFKFHVIQILTLVCFNLMLKIVLLNRLILGYSKCSWTVSPSGRALFSGYLDKTLPKDGKIIRTGYAFLSSYKSRGPFFFDDTHPDFEKFTHFVCRVRGDGRRYFVTFDVSQSLDYTWFFRYKYMLYTHGGPYWQYVKVGKYKLKAIFNRFLLF